jgi:hypothetical protein
LMRSEGVELEIRYQESFWRVVAFNRALGGLEIAAGRFENELHTRTPSRASMSISASVLNGSIRPEADRSPEAPLHGEFRHFVQHFNVSEQNLNPTVLKVYCFYVGKPPLKILLKNPLHLILRAKERFFY